MSSEILTPPIQIWPPRWLPQTAAARNAPVQVCYIFRLLDMLIFELKEHYCMQHNYQCGKY